VVPAGRPPVDGDQVALADHALEPLWTRSPCETIRV
jgi:hypothetical protein